MLHLRLQLVEKITRKINDKNEKLNLRNSITLLVVSVIVRFGNRLDVIDSSVN
jgi:hypothetical protein